MAAAQSTPCRLLGLSAELRNKIYRDVLLEKNWIQVDTRGWPAPVRAVRTDTNVFAQPGLLRTCRQIRAEASSIYYLMNTFGFDVLDCDAEKVIAFCKQSGVHWKTMRLDTMIGTYCVSSPDEVVWSNLWTWLEAYHKGEAPHDKCNCDEVSNSEAVEEKQGCCVLTKMFDFIDELDGRRSMQWQSIRSLLEIAKDLVIIGGCMQVTE